MGKFATIGSFQVSSVQLQNFRIFCSFCYLDVYYVLEFSS